MLTVQQIKDTVADYFKDKPVKEIYLYGSHARGDASEESDVDLLVEYDDSKKLSFSETLDFKLKLEEMFSGKVDLVENRLMYPRIKRNIEADKILIYSKETDIPLVIEHKKSISGKQKRDYIVYLEIMHSSIEKILEFTNGKTETDFIEEHLLKDACMGMFIVIGRNAEKVSLQIKEKFTALEWEGLTEQKNFFDIEGIYTNWRHLWNIINDMLPALKSKIENIIEVLEKEEKWKS